MWNKSDKIAAWVLLCILIVSLLPVMYLGRYNHPTGDDYYYGAETKATWEQTGSFAATVAEAAKGVAYQYNNWQGTYSAMFLMHFPPNILGDWAYRLVTSVLLLLLAGGIFYVSKPVICDMLNGSRALWIIISSLLALICVQTVPSQGETFFWYNGSMYYTGFFAVTLFFFGAVLRYLKNPVWWRAAVLVLLAVFLAGGNYVSLLPALLLLWTLTVLLAYKKSKTVLGIGFAALAMSVGLLVSARAPGNAVRQSDMWKIPAWKAILKSLLQGSRYFWYWTNIWLILALILITPFLWSALEKTKVKFKFPLLAIGFIYGIFCSMSCPLFYTMNSTGPARAVAIVYYGFVLAVFVSYGYLLGYLNQIVKEKQLSKRMTVNVLVCRGGFALVCVLLLGVQIIRGEMNVTTTGTTVRLLVSGEAAAYEQEYQDRLQVLANDAISDVVFKPYGHQPDMLYVGDLTEDPQHVTNQKVAQYFGKNTVWVEY